MREDEFDRCVTIFKLRAARERIRAREGAVRACSGRIEATKRVETFRSAKDSSAREVR
jgi:hypothetical protein